MQIKITYLEIQASCLGDVCLSASVAGGFGVQTVPCTKWTVGFCYWESTQQRLSVCAHHYTCVFTCSWFLFNISHDDPYWSSSRPSFAVPAHLYLWPAPARSLTVIQLLRSADNQMEPPPLYCLPLIVSLFHPISPLHSARYLSYASTSVSPSSITATHSACQSHFYDANTPDHTRPVWIQRSPVFYLLIFANLYVRVE